MIVDILRLLCLVGGCWLTAQLLRFRKHPDRFVMEPLILWMYAAVCGVLLSWAVLAPVFLGNAILCLLCGGALAFCLGLLLLSWFTAVFPYLSRKDSADGTEPALLVLGAPVWNSQPTSLLRSRGEAAARWKVRNPDKAVVLSGGTKDACSEASVLAAMLLEETGSLDNVSLEEQSLTTDENFLFSKAILLDRGWQPSEPLAVATNAFHFFRLRYYGRRCGYGTLHFEIVPTPKDTAMVWNLREAVMLIRYWILKK